LSFGYLNWETSHIDISTTPVLGSLPGSVRARNTVARSRLPWARRGIGAPGSGYTPRSSSTTRSWRSVMAPRKRTVPNHAAQQIQRHIAHSPDCARSARMRSSGEASGARCRPSSSRRFPTKPLRRDAFTPKRMSRSELRFCANASLDAALWLGAAGPRWP
jgi:hypothetical protein